MPKSQLFSVNLSKKIGATMKVAPFSQKCSTFLLPLQAKAPEFIDIHNDVIHHYDKSNSNQEANSEKSDECSAYTLKENPYFRKPRKSSKGLVRKFSALECR